MCLLVLYDAPKRIFSTNSRSSGQPKSDAKTQDFHPPSPLHGNFLQPQQYWHLYGFAILGSTSTVIHSVKQRLLRNRPRKCAATSRDFLRERLQSAFTLAKPASLNRANISILKYSSVSLSGFIHVLRLKWLR